MYSFRRNFDFAFWIVPCTSIHDETSGWRTSEERTHSYLVRDRTREGTFLLNFDISIFFQPDISLPKEVNEIYIKVNSSNKVIGSIYGVRDHQFHRDLWNPKELDAGHQSNAWFASIELCDAVLSNPQHRKIFDELVDKKFDSVVIDDLYNPCGLIHTALQKSVFVYWSMTGLRTESAWANQSPSPPSYIPVYGTG